MFEELHVILAWLTWWSSHPIATLTKTIPKKIKWFYGKLLLIIIRLLDGSVTRNLPIQNS